MIENSWEETTYSARLPVELIEYQYVTCVFTLTAVGQIPCRRARQMAAGRPTH